MDKRNYRRFTTDDNRTILDEMQQPGVTMAEVYRKHGVSPALVYLWRAVAHEAPPEALQQVDSLRAPRERDRQIRANVTADSTRT